MRIELKKNFYLIFYFLLAVVLVFPYLWPEYLLLLDMKFGPNMKADLFYFDDSPIWGGRTWLFSIIQLCQPIVPTWMVQKIILTLIFAFSGIFMHLLIDTSSSSSKYFGGILYVVNPFVYVRFLQGYWTLLFAYSYMPFAVKYFHDFLEVSSKKNFFKILISLFLVSFSSIMLFLSLFAFMTILSFKFLELKFNIRKIVPKLIFLALAFLAVNAYWLVPLATAEENLVQQISEQDLFVFAPRGAGLNTPYSLATMYGFWRGGYIYTKDIFPPWHIFFFIILFLSVYGFISNKRNRKVQSFAAIGIISLLMALSVLGPLKPLFENFAILRAFRDSHKFVGLLVLAYAYLGAWGVDSLLTNLKNNKKVLGVLISALALTTPIVYNFAQFGFLGQIKPTDYPSDWYMANNMLNADNQDFSILFLPWHQYMDFSFIPNRDKRIANPARVFFDKTVISAQNLEVPGIYTQSTNPGQRYVEKLLSTGAITGENLRLLNVKYVILAKEADWALYQDMLKNSDLELVFDSENLMVYKNPMQVSRFYSANELSPKAFEPIEYEIVSPVEYQVAPHENRYTIFVPPNLDSSNWTLDGGEAAARSSYAVWESQGGKVEYWRYRIYEISYIISIGSAIAIAMISLILWKREPLLRKTKVIVRRLFRSGYSSRRSK